MQNRVYSIRVPAWFVAILTLVADDEDLYNYTVFAWNILERIRETRLRRYIDDQDNEKDMGV